MRNRVSKYPGRVLVTPEDGSAPFYATLTRADDPTEEGTSLNKATLLSDETAALYGLGENATVNEVLAVVHDRTEWKVLADETWIQSEYGNPFHGVTVPDLRAYKEFFVALDAGQGTSKFQQRWELAIIQDRTYVVATPVANATQGEQRFSKTPTLSIIPFSDGVIIPAMYEATNFPLGALPTDTPVFTKAITKLSIRPHSEDSAGIGFRAIVFAR